MGADGRRGRVGSGKHPRPPLGASQRWRIGLEKQATDEGPEPELKPLPTIDELGERREAEWVAVDAWLPTLTDDFVDYVHEGGARLADARTCREPRDAAPSRGGGASHRRGPTAGRAGPDQLRRRTGLRRQLAHRRAACGRHSRMPQVRLCPSTGFDLRMNGAGSLRPKSSIPRSLPPCAPRTP